MKLFK